MNINNTGTISAQTTAATQSSNPQNALGKDAFLRILVTQMKNQDPLEPLKDTEFIGQMAQFSSLEQLTNLNKTMDQFMGVQSKKSLADYADLMGNKVYWEQTKDGQPQSGHGIVQALSMKNGEILVELEQQDIKIPIDTINRVEKQSETQNEQETI